MLIDGIYYSDPELISYIKKLKNAVAMNEESQKIADGVIEQLKQENEKLKAYIKFLDSNFFEKGDIIEQLKQKNVRLKGILKQVADDIETFIIRLKENNCRLLCENCLFWNDGKDECVYKYMDEIRKLISNK